LVRQHCGERTVISGKFAGVGAKPTPAAVEANQIHWHDSVAIVWRDRKAAAGRPAVGTDDGDFFCRKGRAMKRKWMVALLAGGLALSAAAEEKLELKTDKEKASYIIGVQTGRNLKKDQVDLDLNLMLKGMQDGMAGKSALSEEETRKFMSGFMNELKRKSRVAAEDSRMKAAEFLQANKTKPGVVVLASGVQYKVLKEGKGKKPVDSDDVIVNYRGALLDGTEFDKTEPGKPATFKLAGLIAGWKEALKLMPVGSKWQLWLPPERAYGEHGAGTIGPNELLSFEVELVGIK
jgi:FKBP-type peptidyl-prolyl cis-trans isomerase